MALPPGPYPGDPLGTRLRTCSDEVLSRLSDAPTVVVLSSGREPTVEDVTELVFEGRRVAVHGEPSLVSAITSRGQVPRVPSGELGGTPAALAAEVHAVRPQARFVSLVVAAGADPAARAGANAALAGALTEVGGAVLLCSGVFSTAGSPDAGAFVPRLVAAFAGAPSDALSRLARSHPETAGELNVLSHVHMLVAARRSRLELLGHASDGETLYTVAAAS